MGTCQMGLVKRSAAQDDALSYEWESDAPADGKDSAIDELLDDGDPISAARGTIVGVIVGGVIWAVIFWMML